MVFLWFSYGFPMVLTHPQVDSPEVHPGPPDFCTRPKSSPPDLARKRSKERGDGLGQHIKMGLLPPNYIYI